MLIHIAHQSFANSSINQIFGEAPILATQDQNTWGAESRASSTEDAGE